MYVYFRNKNALNRLDRTQSCNEKEKKKNPVFAIRTLQAGKYVLFTFLKKHKNVNYVVLHINYQVSTLLIFLPQLTVLLTFLQYMFCSLFSLSTQAQWILCICLLNRLCPVLNFFLVFWNSPTPPAYTTEHNFSVYSAFSTDDLSSNHDVRYLFHYMTEERCLSLF